ncbi:FAD-binding oxidoreductase [Nannocystis punicea]|uniref:Pyridoxamine 5'-phosphate oxidase family protein n=1 Tax=Nannocystis punicea TaxID=2995304 RepID=A0ABY7GVK2_9BACT|nr:pyridoxamine 5'-phosphate oxidase family protein [Nannocystis poenicansa]WAS90849.1 pyridoxamine 5'-phosphate oxidase family protein [Nannocystis poenicansa]
MSTFHAGELAVQERMGVREELAPWAAKVVRPFLPEQHREFYATLPFLVAAARDGQARPWATLLVGPPGFASSPDPRRLVLAAEPGPDDPLAGRLVPGADLGLLGIEPATRRRNRVNGRIASTAANRIELRVEQTFGNCPQHIHERRWRWVDSIAAPAVRSRSFTPAMREQIAAADTLFLASGHRGAGEAASFGMDASHRGGPRGFVEVCDDRRLRFPDYAGNNHFNTVGNLLLDGRAGLLFVDFARGGVLQLTGRVTIDWDSPDVARHPGAQRLLVFELDEAVLRPTALPLRWSADGEASRTLRVLAKRRESDDVVSFLLGSPDGAPLPQFRAGQHLPIALAIPGSRDPVQRTYSLSSGPDEAAYRLSIKRHERGLASRFLHDTVEVGHGLVVRAPAGEFTVAPGARPIVLIGAGIGVTPLLSMLAALVGGDDPRRVLFVHAARDGRHHPFADEIREWARRSPRVALHVQYSRPRPEDRPGVDFDAPGRLDAARLAALLPGRDVDVYLCGPLAFMAAVQEDLERLGVPAEQIHHETMTSSAEP